MLREEELRRSELNPIRLYPSEQTFLAMLLQLLPRDWTELEDETRSNLLVEELHGLLYQFKPNYPGEINLGELYDILHRQGTNSEDIRGKRIVKDPKA